MIDMAKSKFKTGDKVRIVSNDHQPQYEGKIGIVKKAYRTFCDPAGYPDGLWVYRVEVNGETLHGVALGPDLEKV